MKFYIAARYSRLPEMQGYARQLRALGHTVDAEWLDGEHADEDEDPVFFRAQTFAMIDLFDVSQVDVMICFTEEPRGVHTRGGRHFEAGYAYGLGIPLWVVGPRENVFYYLPDIRYFETWGDLVRSLEPSEKQDPFDDTGLPGQARSAA